MKKVLWLGVMLLVVSSLAFATPACVTDTLANYLALSGGCTIGANTFSNWSFGPTAINHSGPGPAPVPIGAGDITVTPLVVPGVGIGFNFAGVFNSTAGIGITNSFTYVIQYDIASGPWIWDNELTAGTGVITGSAFMSLAETKTFDRLPEVNLLVTAPGESDHAVWAPPQTHVVSNTQLGLLSQGPGASVTLDSFTETFSVPEPLSLVLLGSGLLGLGLLRRRVK